MTNIILALGLAWGITLFLWGLGASFTIGARDFIWGILGIGLGYIMVLPITVTAYMRPRAAAVCLSISFLVLETAFFASGGSRVGFLGGLIMAVPTAALVWGYTYVASVRSKSRRSNSSGASSVAG